MRGFLLLLAILLPIAARAQERIDLHTRPNVIQPVYATFTVEGGPQVGTGNSTFSVDRMAGV